MPFLKPRHKLELLSKRKEECTYKNGLRKAIFFNCGDTYVGEWKDNLMHGKGAMTYVHGKLYEGDWENGKRHGFGVLSTQALDDNYDMEYYGFWSNGKKQGLGVSLEDGNFYEGNWQEDDRSGFGKIWYADGSFYEGQWENDKYHGLGRFIYTNGNRYEGNWCKGMKHGRGCMYHIQTGQVQKGIWNKDIAVLSEINDLYWRQAGKTPTEYPIPEIKFQNVEETYKTWETKLKPDEMSCTVLPILDLKGKQ